MHTYTDPTGATHDAIPQTWHHNGISHALAGDWPRAKRAGWKREDAAPGPFRVSKLALLELLIAAGMLDAFLAALNAAPPARVLFDAAQDLASDHPLFTAMLPGVAKALGKTTEEAMDMLRAEAE